MCGKIGERLVGSMSACGLTNGAVLSTVQRRPVVMSTMARRSKVCTGVVWVGLVWERSRGSIWNGMVHGLLVW